MKQLNFVKMDIDDARQPDMKGLAFASLFSREACRSGAPLAGSIAKSLVFADVKWRAAWYLQKPTSEVTASRA